LNLKLDIVHINTQDRVGGAANVAWRLADAQRKAGHRSRLLVGNREGTSDDAIAFPTETSQALAGICAREGHLYYEFQGSHRLHAHPAVRSADLLHFHNLHGQFFNPYSVATLSRLKPAVWTLHDMQSFTGHCAHSFDCQRWETGCGNCPNLRIYPAIAKDATARLWEDKRSIYRHSRLHLVVPSRWLLEKVSRSILSDHPVELVHNGIDTGVFRPFGRREVREALGIPEDTIVIGAAAHCGTIRNPWKGGHHTRAVLEALGGTSLDFLFLDIGGDAPALSCRSMGTGYIHDEKMLAMVYSALDIFLYTPEADNCPLVVLEALACGVPMVSFGVGGIPELIRDGHDGFVVPKGDLEATGRAVIRLATDRPLRCSIGAAARRTAVDRFDHALIADQYERIYRATIDSCEKRPFPRPFRPEEVPEIIRTEAFLAAESGDDAGGSASGGEGPKVSVIVSAYNSEAFMSECLDDLGKQTIAKETQIIVVDAASPQHEGKIVLDRQAGFADLLYVRTPARIGVYAAWNMALRLARGKYVTVFSTNDRLRPDAHEILARSLDENPDVGLVYGDSIITNTPHETFERHTQAGAFRWPEYSFDDLLENCMVGPHPMWRRSIHDVIGTFDEQYAALGDQDFFIRVGEVFPLRHIPVFTGLYWMSPEGLSNQPELSSPEEEKIRAVYRERHKNRKRAVVPDTPAPAAAPAPAVVPASAASGYLFSIVIPVMNNLEYTKNCIASIATNSGASNSYELIVVDNGSTDGTAEFLSALSGDVRIVTNRENLGFSKACNMGAASARGKYIVFLNNDTLVWPGWLDGIRRGFDYYNADICGAKLLYPDGTIQHAGVAFDGLLRPYHLFRGSAADARYVNEPREFRCVTAACMGVRADLFRELGGFDEAFRNGFEDVDLCLRAAHLGFRIVYTPECVVTHLESKTPGRSRFDRENLERLQSKWDGKLRCDDLETCRSFGLIAFRMSDGRAMFLDLGGEITEEREDAFLATDDSSVPFLVDGLPNDELHAKFHSAAGDILARRRRFDEAAARYRAAVELGYRPALADLADCLAKAGRIDEASGCYEAALDLDDGKVRARIGMGTLALISGKLEESASWFKEALVGEPGNPRALCGMGMAAMASGDVEAAIDWYGKALEADPANLTAMHELVKVAFGQGRFDVAETRIRKSLEFEPSNAHLLFSLAGICHKQGKKADALDALDRLDLFSPGYDGSEQLRSQVTA
jgi:GT2 family glycosyltransferase/glycosyltransferase involved in cell wall biosynthesis/Flp pilus assembly protein TadD